MYRRMYRSTQPNCTSLYHFVISTTPSPNGDVDYSVPTSVLIVVFLIKIDRVVIMPGSKLCYI